MCVLRTFFIFFLCVKVRIMDNNNNNKSYCVLTAKKISEAALCQLELQQNTCGFVIQNFEELWNCIIHCIRNGLLERFKWLHKNFELSSLFNNNNNSRHVKEIIELAAECRQWHILYYFKEKYKFSVPDYNLEDEGILAASPKSSMKIYRCWHDSDYVLTENSIMEYANQKSSTIIAECESQSENDISKPDIDQLLYYACCTGRLELLRWIHTTIESFSSIPQRYVSVIVKKQHHHIAKWLHDNEIQIDNEEHSRKDHYDDELKKCRAEYSEDKRKAADVDYTGFPYRSFKCDMQNDLSLKELKQKYSPLQLEYFQWLKMLWESGGKGHLLIFQWIFQSNRMHLRKEHELELIEHLYQQKQFHILERFFILDYDNIRDCLKEEGAFFKDDDMSSALLRYAFWKESNYPYPADYQLHLLLYDLGKPLKFIQERHNKCLYKIPECDVSKVFIHIFTTGRCELLKFLNENVQTYDDEHPTLESYFLVKLTEERKVYEELIVRYKQWHILYYIRSNWIEILPEIDLMKVLPGSSDDINERVTSYAVLCDEDYQFIPLQCIADISLSQCKENHKRHRYVVEKEDIKQLVLSCCSQGRLKLLTWLISTFLDKESWYKIINENKEDINNNIIENSQWHMYAIEWDEDGFIFCADEGINPAEEISQLLDSGIDTEAVGLRTLGMYLQAIKDPDYDTSKPFYMDWNDTKKMCMEEPLHKLINIKSTTRFTWNQDEMQNLYLYCFETGRLNLLHWLKEQSGVAVECTERVRTAIFENNQWHMAVWIQEKMEADFMSVYNISEILYLQLCDSFRELSTLTHILILAQFYQCQMDSDCAGTLKRHGVSQTCW